MLLSEHMNKRRILFFVQENAVHSQSSRQLQTSDADYRRNQLHYRGNPSTHYSIPTVLSKIHGKIRGITTVTEVPITVPLPSPNVLYPQTSEERDTLIYDKSLMATMPESL